MIEKPVVFISHIREEAIVARAFKEAIEQGFLGLAEVFVSSDENSVPLGQNWLDRVTSGLRTAKAMLIVCSPVSVTRPWINFEAGAAWTRNIDAIPLCHSGLRPVELPIPLSLLQGVSAADPEKIKGVFSTVATKLGSKVPVIATENIAETVRDFEHVYIEEMQAATELREVNRLWPELFGSMKSQLTISAAGVPEHKVTSVRPALEALQRKKFLQFAFGLTNMSIGGANSGAFGELNVRLDPRLQAIIRRSA